MWTLTLLTTLAFSGIVSSYISNRGPVALQMALKPRFYCGRELAGVLSALCYDQDGFNKRGDGGYASNSILPPYYSDQIQDIDWPWLSLHKARHLAGRAHGRNKRYIVDECCEKACSVNELLTFC